MISKAALVMGGFSSKKENDTSRLSIARESGSCNLLPPFPEDSYELHQELALAMQDHPDGRQVQVPRFWVAQAIAPEWREVQEEERTERANDFPVQEELDSGIVVSRGDSLRFWHLTFQEYLAARALASRSEDEQRARLLSQRKPYEPEWRETALLLAGALYHQGTRRVDAMFSAVLAGRRPGVRSPRLYLPPVRPGAI
jgi:hypothetical protein